MQGVLQGVGQQLTQFAANAAGALKDFALDRGAITSFDTAKAKVSTLTSDMEGMGRMAREVSAAVGYSASQTEVMAASYDVLSAGFSKASDAANILTAAQKGAIGGMSDIGTVGNATTTILNAYGMSADKANTIVNQMIGTQNAGKIVVGEYASLIGNVATMAAGAGVRLDELNGMIATATVKGVSAGSAIAGIRQGISSILKPSKDASDLADELGISFDAAALKTGGFTGILEQLKAKGADSQGNLIRLFGSVEAVAAIAPSAGAGLADLAKNIETINTSSSEDAFAKMANSMEGLANKNAVLK
jgi:TP901 family phage tail tape measure protein